MDSLFDKEDHAPSGKCCKNIQYKEYPGCKGSNCPKNLGSGPNEVASNYCVEIIKKDGFLWRLCSDKQSVVSKLHTQISYNVWVLKMAGQKIDAKTSEKFMLKISESKNLQTEEMKNWHWDDQKHWQGECKNKANLQSPINIETLRVGKKMQQSSSSMKYGIDYEFSETQTLIKRHYQELHVHFLDAAGVLKLFVDNSSLIYQPQYMSFKFPGEHLYNGKRYPGEVLIHFMEMNPNRKTWVSNGLKVSIPLNPSKDGPNLKFFEDLNPDFWRMGIKQAGEYQPKKVLEKTPLKFDLGALFRSVSIKNPSYYFYVGSQTTPPCLPNVLYVIVSTPIELANCQFKVIRENCLLTDRPKEIHARLPQDLKGRKVHIIGRGSPAGPNGQPLSKIKFTPMIRSVVPQLTRKYAVYNRVIKKTLGIGKRTSFKVALKKMKSCVVSGGGAASRKLVSFVIKQPLRPKTIKALNKHIKRLNKKTIKAMRMRGPGAKQYRKEVLAQVRAETGVMNCDKI